MMTMIGRTVFIASLVVAGVAPAAAQSNPIQIENAHPGSTDWLLTRVMRHDDELYERGWRRRTGIEAYASHTSIKAGETLDVHVSTDPASQYTVSIYRMGYYGGAGARLMRSLGPLQGTVEPTPEDGDRHLVECRWTVGFRLEIPESWVHADADGLLRAKAFLSVGHDEYWTERMFENVTRARDAGVSLAFLSGNSISGVVELLPSTDGRPNRVMRRAGRGFKAEQELMGSTSYGVGFADWTSDEPEHWAFAGTNMKRGDRVAQLVGWEYHGPPLRATGALVVLSQGPVYSASGERRTGTYATTIYTAPKGTLVFNAGTCWWNLVLSSPPGFQNPPRKDFVRDDPRIQRITKNILDRMIARSTQD
jgi:hypothetical protein